MGLTKPRHFDGISIRKLRLYMLVVLAPPFVLAQTQLGDAQLDLGRQAVEADAGRESWLRCGRGSGRHDRRETSVDESREEGFEGEGRSRV